MWYWLLISLMFNTNAYLQYILHNRVFCVGIIPRYKNKLFYWIGNTARWRIGTRREVRSILRVCVLTPHRNNRLYIIHSPRFPTELRVMAVTHWRWIIYLLRNTVLVYYYKRIILSSLVFSLSYFILSYFVHIEKFTVSPRIGAH